MGRSINLLRNYPKSKRDLKKRLNNKSEKVRKIARKFGKDFFDGDRSFGYGGFSYNKKYWLNVIKDFKKFYEAIGPRPSNQYSLDRIDNDKGYEPGNVKWSTDMEQASNKTNNRKFKICCQIKHLREWSRIFGVDYKLAHARIQYGWPVEKALSPVKLRTRKINR